MVRFSAGDAVIKNAVISTQRKRTVTNVRCAVTGVWTILSSSDAFDSFGLHVEHAEMYGNLLIRKDFREPYLIGGASDMPTERQLN